MGYHHHVPVSEAHVRNVLQFIGGERFFWGFDSEFMMSGRVNVPSDVHTVQFSDGAHSFVLESDVDLKQWLHNHVHVKALFGFVVLPDLGSIEEWLPRGNVTIHKRGSQTRGRVKYRGFNAGVYDIQPLLLGFGIRKLADAGDIIGFPKLPKPDYLGLRKWHGDVERAAFLKYAESDAVITSKITKWLHDCFNADPRVHSSAGTLARDLFALPKRLERANVYILISPLEDKIRHCTFAGRNEAFVTGFTRGVTYNDCRSLYPCSMSVTHALEISGATRCNPSDILVSADTPLDTRAYGWLEGVFESGTDLWGLPFRGNKNNFYVTGRVEGLFHSFDLIASKATPVFINRAWRPVFEESPVHNKFVEMTLNRVEGRFQGIDKMHAKAVLNSLSGKLGQSHPVAETSNFFAYNTLLAHSHAVMSRFFDNCKSDILAMDTDSIFSCSDMNGERFDLSDGEHSIPFILDAKGRGDLAFFRSKNYILKAEGEPVLKTRVYGRHGWWYFWEDYLKLFDGTVTELVTRQDVKHTLLTRVKAAQEMAKGRWFTKPVTLTLAKLKLLLKGDLKRCRANFDSYGLLLQKQSCPSRSWTIEEVLQEPRELFRFS
jgi:hypothetical protein